MLRSALQSSLSIQVRSAAVAGTDSSSLRRWYRPRSLASAFTTSLGMCSGVTGGRHVTGNGQRCQRRSPGHWEWVLGSCVTGGRHVTGNWQRCQQRSPGHWEWVAVSRWRNGGTGVVLTSVKNNIIHKKITSSKHLNPDMHSKT